MPLKKIGAQPRDLRKTRSPNDGTRTVAQSILSPEVLLALTDWAAQMDHAPLVIGGVALSFHARPRFTSDVDVLVMDIASIPAFVLGFSHPSKHRFVHKQTHVDIEIVTPQLVNVSPQLFQAVERTALTIGKVRVPTVDGLIALKICKFSRQDIADIEQLLKLKPFNASDWPGLREADVQRFQREFPQE